jgi:hypothetical protein
MPGAQDRGQERKSTRADALRDGAEPSEPGESGRGRAGESTSRAGGECPPGDQEPGADTDKAQPRREG